MAHPPSRRPLVELRQRLCELVELFALPALHVHVRHGKPFGTPQGVEGLAELGGRVANPVPAGRVEPAAVAEHGTDVGGVLPRRHQLEHVERLGDDPKAEDAATEEAERRHDDAAPQVLGRELDLLGGELQPELGRLVDGLEEELVVVRPLFRCLLEREQLVRAQVPLVVARARPREDRRELVREASLLLSRHALSILRAMRSLAFDSLRRESR
jgi:hypothetical protein